MVDHNQQTVLHHAVKRGNMEAVKRLLLLDGHDLMANEDKHGRTPLELARRGNHEAIVAYLEAIPPLLIPTPNGPRHSNCLSDAEGPLPQTTLLSRLKLHINAQPLSWQFLGGLIMIMSLFISHGKF